MVVKTTCEPSPASGGINVSQLGLLFGAETDLDKAVPAADPLVKNGHRYESMPTWRALTVST